MAELSKQVTVTLESNLLRTRWILVRTSLPGPSASPRAEGFNDFNT